MQIEGGGERVRVFVSINWSNMTLMELLSWQESLKAAGIQGYWRSRDNLHLTLKFLGEVRPGEIAGINQALASVGTNFTPFEIRLGGFGVFPNLRQPRILWAGAESAALMRLQRELEAALARQGCDAEKRAFQPHITLASGGIRGFRPSCGEGLPFKVEWVRSFELMESVLEQGKRKYISLGEYLLEAEREGN